MNSTDALLLQLNAEPSCITFTQVMAVIDNEYVFQSVRFNNGNQINDAGQNNGSCKILAFAMLHELSQQQTLHLFGDYYRVDVLQNPLGEDHQNIRQFIDHGWAGVQFSAPPLMPK